MESNKLKTEALLIRVQEAVRATPQASAVADAHETLDWATLWAWSGRLASALREEGVGAGTRVALALPRETALVAGILAIWRLRACYVPLDPALPAARLRWQAEDCGARVLLADTPPAWLPDGVRTLAPQAWREGAQSDEALADAENLVQWPAYVIYTSGSTGRPKGVEIGHAALSAYLGSVSARVPADVRSAAYLSTPAADLGHTALFGALWNGWTLHLVDAQIAADPDAFAAFMETRQVDLLKIVPSHLDALMQAARPEAVLPRRCVVVGGEPAATRLAARIAALRPECVVMNHYGPTETTVGVLTRHGGESRSATLPLGTPLAHVRAAVLNKDGNPVPRGVAGELCIGGDSLASGYLNRAALTAERFVPDPRGGGARLYRTGDKVKQLPGGEFAFLGRLDDQVKIRGYRVEPEEVAARLRLLDGVRDAVVVARRDGEDRGDDQNEEAGALRLIGYVTAQTPLDSEALRAQLAAELPDYMVPTAIGVLAALPLTANGKVDRAALPWPLERAEDTGRAAAPAIVQARNDNERTLLAVWREVLKRETIGVTDNFFEVGGDSILSLQVIAKARRAGLRLTPRQMFDNPTVEGAARVAQSAAPAAPRAAAAVATVETAAANTTNETATPDASLLARAGLAADAARTVEAIYPATPMQQGLLFHGMLEGQPGLYVGQMRLTLVARAPGTLDVAAMRAAWQHVAARHAVLRTRFVWPAEGEPLQIVERTADVPFAVHTLDAANADSVNAACRTFVETGFDAARAPLMRVDLFARPDGAHELVWTHHHALTDGWSSAQVLAEVARAYEALSRGETPAQTAAAPYSRYVQWLAGQRDTQAFWTQRLATRDDPARLADALGPDLRAADASSVPSAGPMLIESLAPALQAHLARAAQDARVTLNTVVQAAWAMVLARFAGRTQVVFGATVSGRPADLADAESIVGLFINSLPLWVDVEPGAAPAAWLRTIHAQTVALQDAAHTPLAKLQQWAGVAGEGLFDSLIVFENYPLDDALQAGQSAFDVRAVETVDSTHYPLTLIVTPGRAAGDGLALKWRHDARRMSRATVERLARQFHAMLEQLADGVGATQAQPQPQPLRLADIALRTDTPPTPPHTAYAFEPVSARLAAITRAQPDAIALLYPADNGDMTALSYAALDAWSARIANLCVRSCAGRTREARIGVAMGRSPALVATLLGVLRAGAAYVPLDPAYPDERLRYIADDAGISLVLCDAAQTARFSTMLPNVRHLAVPCVDETFDAADASFDSPAVDPRQLAYVIYTSGSTGQPKGVGVTQENLARLFDATAPDFAFSAQDVWTLFHSYAFDFSVWELFGALVHGGRLVIVPQDVARDPARLHRLMRDTRVTVLNQTPSAFDALSDYDATQIAGGRALDALDSLRYVIFGGEKLEPSALARWLSAREAQSLDAPALVNMYGITETTVHVTLRKLRREDIFAGAAPSVIGAPLADLSLQVLDGAGRPVPAGAVGELYVGGAGLARGYLGRPALTAERFVPDPYGEPGARRYRSGDVARRLADGDIDYLGRNDSQLKVRGFRIEAGEVEAALRAQAGVRAAVVEVRDQQLVAWVVAAAGAPLTVEAVRAYARAALPAHMVPSRLLVLDSLPMTTNGKLDRRALPAPTAPTEADAAQSAFVEPRDAVERTLAAIWQQVLEVPRVGADDDFFALGGHSLLAVRVLAAVRAKFGAAPDLRALFDYPVLGDFAAAVKAANVADIADVTDIADLQDGSEADTLPLSAGQQRLWFLWKLDPQSAAYHVNGALDLEGTLDRAALQAALDALVARHAALRMRFAETGGVPHLTIQSAARCDLHDVDAAAHDGPLDALLDKLLAQPFDLLNAAPLRVALIRVRADLHVLQFVMHHLIADDWSIGVLLADFVSAYRAHAEAPTTALADSNDAAWHAVVRAQADKLANGGAQRQLDYWKTRLAGASAPLALPVDRVRTGARNSAGARVSVTLAAPVVGALKTQAQARRATLFMTAIAAFNALLHRHTGEADIRIGVPVAHRDLPGAMRLVGFFVNTVVLRTQVSGMTRAAELVEQVRERLLEAYAHQDVAFANVVDALQPERDLSQTPLFQVMVNQQQSHVFDADLGPDLQLRARGEEGAEAQFDLVLNLVEQADGALRMTLTYARDVFDAATAGRMTQQLAALLEQWSRAEDTRVASFVFDDSASVAGPLPAHRYEAVHARFARVARQQPGALALVCDGDAVRYGELAAWAARIGTSLRRAGVGAEARVGVCVGRSPALLAACLGVLRSGAAFVPLDPDYPAERLVAMLDDAKIDYVIADDDGRATLGGALAQRTVLDANALRAGADDAIESLDTIEETRLAYVIYTSGSTGKPKGVAITHGAFDRLLAGVGDFVGLRGDDVWLAATSASFDISLLELYLPLTVGARVELASRETQRDGVRLAALLDQSGATVFQATPSGWKLLLAGGWRGRALKGLCGGEALPPDLAATLLDAGVDLRNMYGPTETTIWSAADTVTRAAPVALGHALADNALRVVGRAGEPVPAGGVGELCIGGANLARGYLGRAAQTAERFVPDPTGVGARMYRTGDLCRVGSDARLSYLGRLDQQIKLRGHRIEPGEIEAVLRRCAGVRDAVVVLNADGGAARLVGYVTGEAGLDCAQINAYLLSQLPEYMVPAALVVLDALPLTPSGKIDRRALPAPTAGAAAHTHREPQTPAEAALLAIWRTVLRSDAIGVTDNFFVAGGDSILSLQIVAKAAEAGLRITPRQLFEAPSVERLARVAVALEVAPSAARDAAGPVEADSMSLWRSLGLTPEHVEDVYAATPLQTGLLYHVLAEPERHAYLNQLRLTLRGPLDRAALAAAWQAALARHAVLRTRFEWRQGGTVMQIVQRRVELPYVELDFSHEGDYEAALAAWRERDLAAGCAPDAAPLMRVALVAREDGVADLVWTYHHLLLDGWSTVRLLDEILRDYRARKDGATATLAPAQPYRRYVEWLERHASADQGEAWWRARAQAAGEPATLLAALPPCVGGEPGTHVRRVELSGDLGARLSDAARAHGVTLNTLMQGAWALLIARHVNHRSVAFGTTLGGRPAQLPGVADMLGLFVNSLPVWVEVAPQARVADWLGDLQRQFGELREHEHTPLARVQQWTGRSADALFDSLFVFENYPVDEIGRDDAAGAAALTIERADSVDPTHYPLAVSVIPRGRLAVEWAWDGARIDRATVDRLAAQYEALLARIIEDGAQRVGELTLPEAARVQEARVYGFASLADSLVAQARRSPDAVALRCEQQSLTYAELERWSGALASLLVARGVRAETRVGLCVERGVGMIAALIGVIRSGGAFVPLDPEYPQARLEQMIEDAGITRVVADARSAARLADVLHGCEVVDVDAARDVSGDAPAVTFHPEQLAYVLYTSGSTGRPKGVAVSHDSLWTHLEDFQSTYQISAQDTVLHSSTINFDVALHEILPALRVGATVEMRGIQPWDLQSLSERLSERRVTFARIPTALWQQWQRHAPARGSLSLRQVTVGGEALPGDALRHWKESALADIRLDNLYGPTETTVAALYRETTIDDTKQVTVPIGKPYPGRSARVIDAFGDEAPAGGLGELCIGGPTVSRGYLGRAALTAERFVPDPSGVPGSRQYRSGDLCRMRADGTVEFLGRLDQQVKLRGQRIELGEIEAVLRHCAGVREAAVIVHGAGEKQRLAGYVAGKVDIATLQRELESRLPGYMVPSSLTVLDKLPVMPNGKLDRKALPQPQEPTGERIAATNATEAALLSIWQMVLGRDDIGVTDNFFEVGGDSIQSLQIIARAREAGLVLTPRQVFEHPTVSALAQRAQRVGDEQTATVDHAESFDLTPIQRRFFEHYPHGEAHWNQSVLLDVHGRLSVAALEQAVAALRERHDALRLRFSQEGGHWRQRTLSAADARAQETGLIHQQTLASPDALSAAGDALQASLDLTRGPIWRVGCFEAGEQSWLLIAIHHLAVDGVSWRILLEELQSAYEQAERGETIALGASSTAWGAWAHALHRYGAAPAIQAEAAWWRDALGAPEGPDAATPEEAAFGVPSGTRMADSVVVEWKLDPQRTRELIQLAPRAWRTRVDELLLAALAQAVGEWSGARTLAVELEGHGREDLIDGIDLSRTVGWFTTRFPVVLPAHAAMPADALIGVKERMRAVPHKGFHWGLLEAERTRRRPAVSFNYLGRFDQAIDADSRFGFSTQSAGRNLSDDARVDYALDLNGLIAGESLVLRWRFDPARLDRATVDRLIEAFERHVHALLAHCVAAPPGATAADFPLSGLNQAQLSALDLKLGNVADIYPATPLQQGLLYHSERQQGQGVYVNQLQLTLRGELDADRLRAVWQAALARHDVLRTRFEWRHGGTALQIVERDAVLPFAVHDWRDVVDYDARLATWRAADLAEGVDPSRAPLMRVNVFRRPDGAFDLVRTHHHVLTDGWSGARLLSEVFDDYARADVEVRAPAQPYRRYIEWLAKQPDARDWWLERLAEGADAGTLTGSLAAPREAGALVPQKIAYTLDVALDARLRRAAQHYRVTLNTLMQGAWAVVLARLSGKRSVAFGVTVSGRPASLPGADNMIGLFINSLPVVTGVPGAARVDDWLGGLQAYNVALRDVEHTPLTSLQQWSGRSGDALFDSLIVFENYPLASGSGREPAALRVERIETVERTHYPLTLTVLPTKQIELQWGWDSRRLERAQVQALHAQYRTVLEQLADTAQTARYVGELSVRTAAPLPGPSHDAGFQPLYARFEQQAARTPARVALRHNGTSIDFATLARWSAAIDARLRASGVAREERVAVCLTRAPALIASMLGVMRSGAAYVPLDPEFPVERLRYMLDDAGITRIVTDAQGIARLGGGLDARTVIDAGSPDDVRAAPALVEPLPEARAVHDVQLAYVIYTSGSTGRPKGVAVSHGALDRFLCSVREAPGIGADDVLLSVTTASFDISLLEFCLPLMTGATLELADARVAADGEALAHLIDTSGATLLQATPSGWRLLLEAGWRGVAAGRRLTGIAGGEALPPDLCAQLLGLGVDLWNLYGPTETTIWSSRAHMTAQGALTIGHALHANALRVIDASGQWTPTGGIGELCIGGDNLARGYLGRPGLSAERFVPDPDGAPGARMYRTGDLARERADGAFECLGRIDQQVKLRGYRIELGEIEEALRACEGVLDAAVALLPGAPGSADARLVGYVVGEMPPGWRQALGARLPAYMIPASLHGVEALPRTANGKLDRQKLAQIEVGQARESAWTEPAAGLEATIAQVFGEVLGVERVGAHDDFFALGGHSLVAVRVNTRLAQQLGRKLELALLFEYATPSALAAALDAPTRNDVTAASATDSDLQALDDLFNALD
ncbi:non-ribosomal peptide synthase protein (TIGR01720 family)/amino acid adenylation domain-containing protein [Paraburkholderia eburnea]|uniref:Non-ribosomal peptide synthase protein (TIGR01720 family)/amino acid adenylation domain-containing protein n=1 Tax=Paraburkholderia eburnea TaxID=1189126 RepID=A0A2S4MA01_9BURK|nr:non-ribosomal peptide synthetase [Paraburkholderia eburnea]POR51580.1 non-ribosomal peptide synthase protein (TIGR01720 family)/amino acid adenylation domain-containing protein [Paraburkholderia eburnea]PRZ22611.1 non-ribosomal peptide synthase protein (TIGR01720 family)/amino acid adenylation domain-containing protein [Paraburkholderia eburnea]